MASGQPRLPGYVVLQRTIAALTEKARFGIELWIGDGMGVLLLEVTMPGDPKEARVHAANCIRLAETASSPTVHKTFADLAAQWNRLANELEDALALLKALNEIDLQPVPNLADEKEIERLETH